MNAKELLQMGTELQALDSDLEVIPFEEVWKACDSVRLNRSKKSVNIVFEGVARNYPLTGQLQAHIRPVGSEPIVRQYPDEDEPRTFEPQGQKFPKGTELVMLKATATDGTEFTAIGFAGGEELDFSKDFAQAEKAEAEPASEELVNKE